MWGPMLSRELAAAILLLGPSSLVLANNVLTTSGFTNCDENPTIKVNDANVTFDQTSGNINFDVSGISNEVQNVTASLIVTAYGQQVYEKDFNPCDQPVITQLCPGVFEHVGIKYPLLTGSSSQG